MIRRGSLIIEVLLSAGLIAVFALFLSGLLVVTSKTNRLAKEESQAAAYAQQNMEQLVAIKNTKWSDLSTGTFYISKSGPTSYGLNATPTGDTLDGLYHRLITITEVRRDASQNIVTTGGTVNGKSLQANVTVSWSDNGNHQVMLVNYFTNWKDLP